MKRLSVKTSVRTSRFSGFLFFGKAFVFRQNFWGIVLRTVIVIQKSNVFIHCTEIDNAFSVQNGNRDGSVEPVKLRIIIVLEVVYEDCFFHRVDYPVFPHAGRE